MRPASLYITNLKRGKNDIYPLKPCDNRKNLSKPKSDFLRLLAVKQLCILGPLYTSVAVFYFCMNYYNCQFLYALLQLKDLLQHYCNCQSQIQYYSITILQYYVWFLYALLSLPTFLCASQFIAFQCNNVIDNFVLMQLSTIVRCKRNINIINVIR